MTAKRNKKVCVGFVALGCPKNTVDSEKMLADITQAGFVLSTPETADVVIINTCGFIEPAKAESIEAIRRAIEDKRKGLIRKVVVTGCLPERLGDTLFDQVPGIDALVGLAHRDHLPEILLQICQADRPSAFLGGPVPDVCDDRVRLRIGPAHWAYLRISEGCNHRCSFCTIPSIRGPFRSKPHTQVVQEAGQLVASGVKELNIVAQDTTSYERDIKVRDGLAKLLADLEAIERLTWIRLLYLYPTGLTDALVETLASSRKIVPYLDIPIQHVHPQVLRAMGRPGNRLDLETLIDRLRKAMPNIALRTTVIVGFPGETEQHFQDLLEFIQAAQFDALGCFPFYPEPGTRAADLPGQIPPPVRQQRLDTVMRVQQRIAFAKNRLRMGQTLSCLIDSVAPDGTAIGRFYGQAPEIDGLCLLRKAKVRPGRFVQVRVVGWQDYDLIVEPV